jgi:RNA recognition motif-containing protein
MPKDRVTNTHQGYGFVEFKSEEDSEYAIKVLNMVKLFGKPIRVSKSSQDKNSQVGQDCGSQQHVTLLRGKGRGPAMPHILSPSPASPALGCGGQPLHRQPGP